MDAPASGKRRAALDLGARRRDELRDARARPAAARLRPGQAARPDRRALGPQGRKGPAAERAGGRSRRVGAVHHRRFGRDRPGRHHGRREHQGGRGDEEHLPRVRVLPSRGGGATRLILDLCGGEPGPTVDKVARLPQRKPVRMRVARAQKILGVPVPATEMQRAFARLAFPMKRGKDAFTVTPPSYRFDIAIEEDLIEEVARLYGFERIAAHPPRVHAAMLPAPETRRPLHALSERLAAADYREVINFSFVEPAWEADFAGEANPIRLLNPIASHQSVMRTSVIGSLIEVVRKNHSRKVPRIRVFEVGRVYLRDASAQDGPLSVAGVRQPVRIGAAAYGPVLDEQWDIPVRGVDFFDVKADLENLVAPLPVRFEPAA